MQQDMACVLSIPQRCRYDTIMVPTSKRSSDKNLFAIRKWPLQGFRQTKTKIKTSSVSRFYISCGVSQVRTRIVRAEIRYVAMRWHQRRCDPGSMLAIDVLSNWP